MNGAYGIHDNEMLFTVMGTGCVSVTKTEEGYVGKWKDGRLGIVGAAKMGEKAPRIQVVGSEGTADYVDSGGVYDALILATAEFFHTGKPPVEPEVAVEIIEFMVAARLSNGAEGRGGDAGGSAEAAGVDLRRADQDQKEERCQRGVARNEENDPSRTSNPDIEGDESCRTARPS